MEDQPLCVFAVKTEPPSLRRVREALLRAGHPAGIGLDYAGEATEEELDQPDWETLTLRWNEPEFHEIALIEQDVVGEEEEADTLLARARRFAESSADVAGQMIVLEHLDRTRIVYSVEIYYPLIEDDDHPGWGGLDVVLRAIAQETDGLIYAEPEGFWDADGELILTEEEETESLVIPDLLSPKWSISKDEHSDR